MKKKNPVVIFFKYSPTLEKKCAARKEGVAQKQDYYPTWKGPEISVTLEESYLNIDQ